jgi:hypothetical protein
MIWRGAQCGYYELIIRRPTVLLDESERTPIALDAKSNSERIRFLAPSSQALVLWRFAGSDRPEFIRREKIQEEKQKKGAKRKETGPLLSSTKSLVIGSF